MPAPTERSRLLRDNVTVALGTATSRVTGLLRVLVLGWAIVPVIDGEADGRLSDAYNLANTTPNIIYELILGGILSATLVPIFTRAFADRDRRAIDAIVGTSLALLAALTVVATAAAPLIIWVYTAARDGEDASDYRSVATKLAFLFLPQIFFYGLMSVTSALLNARRRFFAAAWAPVLVNVIVIVGLVLARSSVSGVPSLDTATSDTTLVLLLGLGATVGVATMALVMLPALRHAGIHLRPRVDINHPAVREVVRLSGWTVGYVVANQVTLAIVTVLAQRDAGGLTAYTTMFIFFQLPHGLLAVTVMTTYTPELSAAAGESDWRRFRISMRSGVRIIVALLLPAATLYAVLAGPATHLSGRFADLSDAEPVLRAFAVGLVGFSSYLFVLRGFYAQKDTRTPFRLNVLQNGLNVVLAVAFVGPWGVPGLAWAYSVSYTIAAIVSWIALGRTVRGGLRTDLLVPVLGRAAIAALVMGITAWLARDLAGGESGWRAIVRLAVAGGLALLVYACTLAGLGGMDPRRRTLPFPR